MSGYIEIKLPGHLLVLTESELLRLLKYDKEIWARGIRRGKGIKRARAASRRETKDTASKIRTR